MTTKIRTAHGKGDTASAASALLEGLRGEASDPKLVVVFTSTTQDLPEVAAKIQDEFPSSVVLSSTTSGEFVATGDFKGEAVAWAVWSETMKVHAGLGKNLKAEVDVAVQAAIPTVEDDPDLPHRTAILLLDPLSGNGEEASLMASAFLGPTVRLAGGAAGDDLKFEQTLVGVGKDVASDAVAIAVLQTEKPLGIGVKHGHEPISPPMTVTKASGGNVAEIEGRPAFEVWKETVGPLLAEEGVDIETVTDEELGGYLLRFEFGLIVGPNEYKIRAPLSVGEGNSLNCACGLPEGAVMRIMRGNPQEQIDAARTAAQAARKALEGHEIAGALIFDCICRNLILADGFKTAVQEMQAALDGCPLAGFETYGEIAMELGQTSGFHNTTTVVLAFPA